MSENKVTQKKRSKVPSYEELSTEAITALRAALGEDAVITTNRGY